MPLAMAALAAGVFLSMGCTYAGRTAPEHATFHESEVVEEFWPNGETRLRKYVVGIDGAIDHGPYTKWYDNGQKEYEATVVMGKKDGLVTRWHRNGQKWKEERYANGKRHGVSVSWDQSGRKRQEERHLDGKPHGTWTIWAPDGRVKAQQHFDHGKPLP